MTWKNEEQLSPEVMYGLFAEVGFRRHFHLGGQDATKELVELCNIDRNKYVLDVGCASGKTACYIAKRYGCKVVGVDLLEKMINRAKERAKREGVEDLVRFQVANAQHLPFEDNLFDVVIGEFITGLLDDKRRGVKEYLRVIKPGGIIGLNEATWIKTPPPEKLVEYLSQVFGFKGEILTSDGWVELLEEAKLNEMIVRTCKV
ncbi:MAG: class I SAM-dependent methyltransferase [Candidatus Methanoperedens sp.]|nr:class I SAM-dependent methyltransferase [Candidatus Methanoperedens sp.]